MRLVAPPGDADPVQVKRYPAITSQGSPVFTRSEMTASLCEAAPQGGMVTLQETNTWKPEKRGVIPKGKGFAHAGQTFSTKVVGKPAATYTSDPAAIPCPE